MLKKFIVIETLIICLLLIVSTLAFGLDGETIVSGKCTACHGIDRIKNTRKTSGDWSDTVDREINRGAQLNSAERAAVIDYLSANYGTDSQSAAADQSQTNTEVQNPAPTNQTTTQNSTTTESTPNKQAYTGIEMWQLILLGGSLIGGGVFIRKKK